MSLAKTLFIALCSAATYAAVFVGVATPQLALARDFDDGGSSPSADNTGGQCIPCQYASVPKKACAGGGTCNQPPPSPQGPVPMATGNAVTSQAATPKAGSDPDSMTSCLAGKLGDALSDAFESAAKGGGAASPGGGSDPVQQLEDALSNAQNAGKCCPTCVGSQEEVDWDACVSLICDNAGDKAPQLAALCKAAPVIQALRDCVANPIIDDTVTMACQINDALNNPPVPPNACVANSAGDGNNLFKQTACNHCCQRAGDGDSCMAACSAAYGGG